MGALTSTRRPWAQNPASSSWPLPHSFYPSRSLPPDSSPGLLCPSASGTGRPCTTSFPHFSGSQTGWLRSESRPCPEQLQVGECWAAPLVSLHLPSCKTEERAWSQQQRHQWFNGWGDLTCLKQGPGATPHQVQQTVGKTWWQSSLLGGKGRLPVIGELRSAGLTSYQRNQQRGMPLTAPLMRTITSWGLGRVLRRSVVCVKYR